MKHITTYIENGRTFEICKKIGNGSDAGFWAFEDKYIDADGKLTKQFNGISGYHSETAAETIQKVSNQIKVDALVADGMDLMEASLLVICGAETLNAWRNR